MQIYQYTVEFNDFAEPQAPYQRPYSRMLGMPFNNKNNIGNDGYIFRIQYNNYRIGSSYEIA